MTYPKFEPCKLCKSNDTVLLEKNEHFYSPFYVYCGRCRLECTFSKGKTGTEAIENWNALQREEGKE